MDRRSYLISVFDDTLERIKDDAELLPPQNGGRSMPCRN